MISLYIIKSCPEVIPLVSELQRLGVEYATLDIDKDADAGQRLLDLTGDLAVPTLELEDDSIFVRPSIEKVRELFGIEAQESQEQLRQEKSFLAKLAFFPFSILGFALFIFSAVQLAMMDVPHNWIWWGLGINIIFGIVIGVLQRRNIKPVWMGLLFALHWAMLGANLGIGISVYDLTVDLWGLFQRVLQAVGLAYLILWLTQSWWKKQGFNFQRWQVWLGVATTVGFIIMLIVSLIKPEYSRYTIPFMLIPVGLLLIVSLFKVVSQQNEAAIKLSAMLVYSMVALASLLAYL